MKKNNSTLDTECSRCHNDQALHDVGLCMDCMYLESGERLQARLKDGSIEKAITRLEHFVQTLKLTQNFSVANQRSYHEFIKQIDIV